MQVIIYYYEGFSTRFRNRKSNQFIIDYAKVGTRPKLLCPKKYLYYRELCCIYRLRDSTAMCYKILINYLISSDTVILKQKFALRVTNEYIEK